jgi:hypothetical protein
MQIPSSVLKVVRSFNDVGVDLFGITCTLYVPTNLTVLEPADAYRAPADHVYRRYDQVPVWITWFEKDIHRLRKLGIFAEDETPSFARFKNVPEVILHSYIKLDQKYIPDAYDVDEFEMVDVMMTNFYGEEIYRYFKVAPRRNGP